MLYDSLWYQDNLIFVTQTFFIVLKKNKKKENGFYFQSKHIWWSEEFFFLSVSLFLNVVKKMLWIMPIILSISIAKSTSFLENKWKSMSRNLLSMRRQLNSFSQSHDNLGNFSHVARILHYDVRKKIWPVWTHDVSEKNFSSLLNVISSIFIPMNRANMPCIRTKLMKRKKTAVSHYFSLLWMSWSMLLSNGISD